MKASEFNDFATLINSVSDLYGKQVSDIALSLWWNALKHFDLPAIREALSAHVRNPDNGQFMPKPADIIRLLGGTTTDSAMLAWSKVDKAVREVGTYRDIAFDDSIIHRVIYDMGGWPIFGTKTEDEWPFVAREFQTRYRGYAITGVTEYPKLLVGLANAHNVSHGHELQPVTYFGEPEKVKQVIAAAKDIPSQIQRVDYFLNAPNSSKALEAA